jgi:hypothetical protein
VVPAYLDLCQPSVAVPNLWEDTGRAGCPPVFVPPKQADERLRKRVS